MNSTSIGQAVETAVAKHLAPKGYKLIEQNWKTTYCEVDLVMKKDEVMYFVEVKFRARDSSGEGFDYITPKKLSQMQKAARIWCNMHGWDGDAELMVASVDGERSRIRLVEV